MSPEVDSTITTRPSACGPRAARSISCLALRSFTLQPGFCDSSACRRRGCRGTVRKAVQTDQRRIADQSIDAVHVITAILQSMRRSHRLGNDRSPRIRAKREWLTAIHSRGIELCQICSAWATRRGTRRGRRSLVHADRSLEERPRHLLAACLMASSVCAGAAALPAADPPATTQDELPRYQKRLERPKPLVAIVGENYYTELTDFVYSVWRGSTRSGVADVVTLRHAAGPGAHVLGIDVLPEHHPRPSSTRAIRKARTT